ncbi:hypothetical protein BDV28DRAFT_74516 [Aspergillus coremiiformis]|uniref:Uncharacterized protein n=1 Tax=Aspergillus coremiiformis TaxID=138285 RepID=A0A5N6ZBA7_9EURO|nr:hypothetical protein BDV28DRAFT_74516 [Aspergillus coremiiformis]
MSTSRIFAAHNRRLIIMVILLHSKWVYLHFLLFKGYFRHLTFFSSPSSFIPLCTILYSSFSLFSFYLSFDLNLTFVPF